MRTKDVGGFSGSGGRLVLYQKLRLAKSAPLPTSHRRAQLIVDVALGRLPTKRLAAGGSTKEGVPRELLFLHQLLPSVRPGHGPVRNPGYDMMASLRLFRLRDGNGRPIVSALKSRIAALGFISEKAQRDALHVASELTAWCPSRRLPPVVEAITLRTAKAFLRDLAKDGKAPSTIARYRAVLSRVWAHIGKEQVQFIQNAANRVSHARATFIENPWHGLPVPAIKAKRPHREVSDGASANRNRVGLKAGPPAAANKAKLNAHHMRPALRAIKKRGILSLRGVAAELHKANFAAPRGGRYSATQVKRLMDQAGWDRL